jgi:hypothetical protein
MFISHFDLIVILSTLLVLAIVYKLPEKMKPKSLLLLALLPLYIYSFPKVSERLELASEKIRHPNADGFNLLYIIFTWPKYWAIAIVFSLLLLHLSKNRLAKNETSKKKAADK